MQFSSGRILKCQVTLFKTANMGPDIAKMYS